MPNNPKIMKTIFIISILTIICYNCTIPPPMILSNKEPTFSKPVKKIFIVSSNPIVDKHMPNTFKIHEEEYKMHKFSKAIADDISIYI